MKNKKIYFDMDGTIADLYGTKDWLNLLQTESRNLFRNLKVMHDKAKLTRVIENLQSLEYEIEVITWTPKNVSEEYIEIVAEEKKEWIAEHFPMIKKVHCVGYGIPKQTVIKTREKEQILVDDNLEVTEMWNTPKRRKSIIADKNLIKNLELLLL